MSTYSGFTNTKYKPTSRDLVATFRVSSKGVSFSEAANAVAGESSIGTWTEVYTEDKKMAKKLKPTIFKQNPKTKLISIAYPEELFEAGNIPQTLSSIAGNIYGMKLVSGLRFEDITFPKNYLKKFKGPYYGIEGIRKLLKIKERPLVGTIVKPKLGLNPAKHAKVAYDAWIGGCDIVKDDENLTSMKFNEFNSRISKTLNLLDKAETKTGDVKVYMPNISAPYDEMIKRAEFVKSHSGKYLMVDVVTVGFSALQSLRNENFKLVFHAHRAGHAAFTRSKDHGISMLVFAKFCRLCGMDQLHTGTVLGKMEGSRDEVIEINNAMRSKINMPGIKTTLPVASGGVYPTLVPEMMKLMGNDIAIQAGGGIHGHPQGTTAGAKAMLQAVHAAMNKVPLEKYALVHPELKSALKKWKN
ncbi:MAG: type III ribulose-bisphosphate carboxylase [Candidatus Diapherotrites archaeon]